MPAPAIGPSTRRPRQEVFGGRGSDRFSGGVGTHNSLSFDLSDRSESGAEGMIGSSEAIDLRA
jgi:hypothetical protein